jgi:hypothetical protein
LWLEPDRRTSSSFAGPDGIEGAMARNTQIRDRWSVVLAFVLVFYGNGAALLESFVNYPS